MKKLLVTLIAVGAITAFARSQKSGEITFGELIQLKSNPEFVETGRWSLGLENIYESLETSGYTTNTYGMILAWKTSANELSKYKFKKLAMDTIDGCDNTPLTYNWTPVTPDDISITIAADGTTIANKPGTVNVTATDGKYTVSKLVSFNNFSSGKAIALWSGNTREFENELFTEWYGYIQNRATNEIRTIDSGYNYCGGLICSNDFVWKEHVYTYGSGSAYSDELYVPKRAVAFRLLSTGNPIRNSGNCIGNKVSINCFHYNDLARQAYVTCNYNHRWVKPDGTSGTVHTSKASALSEWAREKGIYSDDEISVCNDMLAYVYDTEVPEECQAGIIKGTIDDAAPNATNAVNFYKGPGFTITQHGTIQPAYLSGVYRNDTIKSSYISIGDGSATIDWQDYTKTTEIEAAAIRGWRHDTVSYGSIYPYHTAHVCDSGRPGFRIFRGEPIFEFAYHYAGSGPSVSLAWRIIRDFCKENGSTLNLWDITTRTKTVVQP